LVVFCTIAVENLGSNYPDFEPGKECWNQIPVLGFDYKSLDISTNGTRHRQIGVNVAVYRR